MTTARVPAGSIVVAVDGSEHDDRALTWSVDHARLTHRHLAVVHCRDHLEPPGVLTDAAGTVQLLADDVDSSAHLIEDDPRDALKALSADAALLVLGSRGRGAVRSALLGSVSAAVARTADCPVVICRPPEESDEASHERRVLVGADGSGESTPVLEFAFEQASLRGWPLTVMHCFWDVAAATLGRGTVTSQTDDGLDDLRLLLGEAVAGFAEKYPDVPVTKELARGLVDECLAGHSSDAALLVVGRSPSTLLNRFLYSTSALAVLERAETTVAVVPETHFERKHP